MSLTLSEPASMHSYRQCGEIMVRLLTRSTSGTIYIACDELPLSQPSPKRPSILHQLSRQSAFPRIRLIKAPRDQMMKWLKSSQAACRLVYKIFATVLCRCGWAIGMGVIILRPGAIIYSLELQSISMSQMTANISGRGGCLHCS